MAIRSATAASITTARRRPTISARYYDPNIGRFTQQDTHWNTANSIYGDNPQKINEREDKLGLKTYSYAPQITAVMQSGNLYVYCGNSPTSYTDPNGSEWYHWLIGGLIVAAATTASTIAAGAFIGTSLMLSIAILDADITSIETFNSSADWVTVGGAFTGGLLGGGYGYSLAHSDELLNVRKIAGKTANAERVGTALKKNDTYHRAGSFLTKAQLSKGHAYYIIGGDGIRRIFFQVRGTVNGVHGIFEFILQPDGTVSHQLFTEY